MFFLTFWEGTGTALALVGAAVNTKGMRWPVRVAVLILIILFCLCAIQTGRIHTGPEALLAWLGSGLCVIMAGVLMWYERSHQGSRRS